MSGMLSARHSTETNNHYTPKWVCDAARALLGGIDTDPASSEAGNRNVCAGEFFTAESNGFTRDWHGSTFLNPPGGFCDSLGQRVIKASKGKPACCVTGECGLEPGHKHDCCISSQKAWWFKLARQYREGHVKAAIFVSFSIELLQTTQSKTPMFEHPVNAHEEREAIPLDFPICYPSERIAYEKPDGTVGDSPTHASCLIYLPPRDLVGGYETALRALRGRFGQFGDCK